MAIDQVRPDQFQHILGQTFVRKSHDVVFRLTSGKAYDRYQLAALGAPQIKAARYLHLICQRLSIATSHQLAARVGEVLAVKGIGHAAFYVALAVLHSEGIDQKAVEVYADLAVSKVHHNPGTKDWEPVPVMLATLKRRKAVKPKAKKRVA